MNQTQFRKEEALCNQFNMTQCIDVPTHFTENSHSTNDLLFLPIKTQYLQRALANLVLIFQCGITVLSLGSLIF